MHILAPTLPAANCPTSIVAALNWLFTKRLCCTGCLGSLHQQYSCISVGNAQHTSAVLVYTSKVTGKHNHVGFLLFV
jgi:hypothetical protein